MEVESDLTLPVYTETEVLMDDVQLSTIDFMSRFERFKVDEVSIDEAEDNICFNAQEGSSYIGLNGLKYTEDEITVEWEKRKEGYTPDLKLPSTFQELCNNKFEDMCSFLYALHPVNVNKETINILGSVHILTEKKLLKQKLLSTLKGWFFHPEAFSLPTPGKKEDSTQEPSIEMGFVTSLLKCSKFEKF